MASLPMGIFRHLIDWIIDLFIKSFSPDSLHVELIAFNELIQTSVCVVEHLIVYIKRSLQQVSDTSPHLFG